MNISLKAFLLKIPPVRDYVSRVRQHREALEQEMQKLRHAAAEEADRYHTQVDLVSGQLDDVIRERDHLVADLMAARSARENLASMLSAANSRISGIESERGRLAVEAHHRIAALESERERLKADIDAAHEGQSELDAHRRALIAQLEVLKSEHASVVERMDSNQRLLVSRNELLGATEQWLKRELARAGRKIEALSAKAGTDTLSTDWVLPRQSVGHTILHAQAIQCLFQLLLDRQPRQEEKEQYFSELAAGTSYEVLACQILLSPEGRKDPRNRERYATMYERHFPFPTHIVPESDVFPINIVDVGAQLLDMMDHVYAPLLRDRRCRVVGFEPLQDEAARRSAHETDAEILTYFIGDGEDATFHVNAFNPTSSIYPSNPDMKKFKGLAIVLPTLSTQPARTRRLDAIPEATGCDYLKIDVQGAELKVLSGAPELLKMVSAVHLEVEFDEVYLGQPLFAKIDTQLRTAEFELIDFYAAGYDTYVEAPPGCEGSRLLWHDALYMKRDDRMTDEMLLKGAYIAHVNYRKYDLAAHLLAIYDSRRKTHILPKYQGLFCSCSATQGPATRLVLRP